MNAHLRPLVSLRSLHRPPQVCASVIDDKLIDKCIRYSTILQQTRDLDDDEDSEVVISPTTTATSAFSLSFGSNDQSSATSFTPDPHAVSRTEALAYYSGLASEPRLVYRTGAPVAQRRRKELREVYNHPLVALWNDGLAWKVVDIMDAHGILFTTLDVVRFQTEKEGSTDEDDGEETAEVRKKPAVGPVTIWVGVFPDRISATVAHDAAKVVLGLLAGHQITDVDVDFREAGPQLLSPVRDLNPLVDVISPLTPTLGLHISTTARPRAQGTMGLYLAEGGESDSLLGLTCNHVLLNSNEGRVDYVYHPSAPAKNVVLLGRKAYDKLVGSVKLKIARHGISFRHWRTEIQRLVEEEKGSDPNDERVKTQALLDDAETALAALADLLDRIEKKWKKIGDRILGHVIRAPAIRLGVGEERFTEDWGVFRLSRDKLVQGFQGNKIDLGTKMTREDFTLKCFPCGDANWCFEYPANRLLPIHGIISDKLMRAPDMWDLDSKPCLLVVKNGNATNTTLGRANGVFSIVRDYSMKTAQDTSMEWGIINYDSKSDVFSEPGDSGAIIADIRGRAGGLLTGGTGKTKTSDLTYATPLWWLLRRIKANGLPDVNLNVFE
ncbi:hypothetical protein H4582DRAFT_2121903 [Lactarius indigo]|nr:hypothetical protein H4582DRAFT_2121903 [Lactarius indigo]